MKQPIVILGAGGFAKEVFSWINQDEYDVFAFYSEYQGEVVNIYGKPVVQKLDNYKFMNYICAIGEPKARQKLCQFAEIHQLIPCLPIVHRSVILGANINIGRGTVLCPKSIITADVQVGKHVIVNIGATIGHDCDIGNFVTISPGANISGKVSVGPFSYIGTNASIREKINIGACAIVGMGSTVVKDVKDEITVIGVAAHERN